MDFDKSDKVNHPKIHSVFSHDEFKKMLFEVGFTSTKMMTFYQGDRIFANQNASMFISNSIKCFTKQLGAIFTLRNSLLHKKVPNN